MNPRRNRIEFPATGDDMIVSGPALFREIVNLQDDSFARFCQSSDHLWDERVFSQRVVVEVPDGGGASKGFTRCGTQGAGEFSGRGISRITAITQSRNNTDRQIIPVSIGPRADKNHVANPGSRQRAGCGGDDLRDAARAEMIVDDGDSHASSLPDQFPIGLMI